MKAQLYKRGGRILLGENTGDGAVILRSVMLQDVLEFGIQLYSLL
jgi:hypothetical protein